MPNISRGILTLCVGWHDAANDNKSHTVTVPHTCQRIVESAQAFLPICQNLQNREVWASNMIVGNFGEGMFVTPEGYLNDSLLCSSCSTCTLTHLKFPQETRLRKQAGRVLSLPLACVSASARHCLTLKHRESL